MKARNLHLYSEKVSAEEFKNLLNHVARSRLPLLGFIDLSGIFSLNFLKLIVKRKSNTLMFFVKDKKELQNLSPLIFPFRLSETEELETAKGSYLPLPKMFFLSGKSEFLNFMLKGNFEEVQLGFTRVLGRTVAMGSATDDKGKKSMILVTSPEQFFVIDLEKNPSIYIDLLDPIPKKMAMSSKFPIFKEPGMSIGADNFDVFQHTLFLGASGTGKSKAIYVFLRAIEEKYGDDVRIIVLDPHSEFIRMFPKAKIVNFTDNYVEPLEVGGQKTPLMTQLVAQLLASAIGQENKYSERVLFYAVHLLSSIDKLNLANISLLLTDASKKAEFVSICENDEVKRFFDEEFNDIYIHHFNDAVLPILNFIGEYQLYLGKAINKERLFDLLQENRITVLSFNPNFFGRRMINFLAGAVINQMYILAITGKLDKKTILVIDEFPRVETRVTRDILSETRKFNLYPYLSMQYLNQVNKEIYDSILSNIRNIIAFKLNKQDAASMSSIMEIKVEEYFKKHRSQGEIEEAKKEMFARLQQRECIARLFNGKSYLLPMKLKVVDVKDWAEPGTVFDETIAETNRQAADKASEAEKESDAQKEAESQKGLEAQKGMETAMEPEAMKEPEPQKEAEPLEKPMATREEPQPESKMEIEPQEEEPQTEDTIEPVQQEPEQAKKAPKGRNVLVVGYGSSRSSEGESALKPKRQSASEAEEETDAKISKIKRMAEALKKKLNSRKKKK